MAAIPVIVAGSAALALLFFLGGGDTSPAPGPGPGPSPEPRPPTPNDDEERIQDLLDVTDDELRLLLCPVWIYLGTVWPVVLPSDAAKHFLAQTFPLHTWPPPPSTTDPARKLWTRIADGFNSIKMGSWSCEDGRIDPDEIHDTPTPGGYYQIRKGDTPLGVAGKAMPMLDAQGRIDYLKLVNKDPRNQGLLVAATQEFTKKYIGDQIVSFFPKWRRLPDPLDLPTTVSQRFEPGQYYALVYLPSV